MKNVLLGFLMATCMFLMIGATQEMFVTTSENGKYQAWSESGSDSSVSQYMINTRTGELYKLTSSYGGTDGWYKTTSDTKWIYE